jgi:hypothetical protein
MFRPILTHFLGAAVLIAAGAAHAQRNEVWRNPGLSGQGLQSGEMQVILRQDSTHCHGMAFEGARQIGDEDKRRALGKELFVRCMAEKGWFASTPERPKAPLKPPRETAT